MDNDEREQLTAAQDLANTCVEDMVELPPKEAVKEISRLAAIYEITANILRTMLKMKSKEKLH